MQINYNTVGKLKGYFITGSSIAGSTITAHLAMNVIPGAVMGRAYQAAKAGAKAGLGPLAPYFATSINNTALVASAEVYTKLKGTGYFGWTISAFTKASAVGGLVGAGAATAVCEVLKSAHTAYVKEKYQLSLSKVKDSIYTEQLLAGNDGLSTSVVDIIPSQAIQPIREIRDESYARFIMNQQNLAQSQNYELVDG